MRTKEFIIFIIIFTIFYIIFFVLYDKFIKSKNDKLILKLFDSSVDINKYYKFSYFYGINSSLTKDKIFEIYNTCITNSNNRLSFIANKCSLNVNELVIVILYLEYLELLPRKKISIINDYYQTLGYVDQNYILKYSSHFNEKKSFDMLLSIYGNSINNELLYIDSNYLFPGVRIIDSKIYYIGDYL